MSEVQVAAAQISVGGVRRCVNHEVKAIVLGHAIALVVRVLDHLDAAVMAPGNKLVWAVANRVLTELLRILERGFRKRHVRVAAGLDRKCGIRLAELHIDGVIVHNLQTGERCARVNIRLLQIVITLNGAEEAGATLLVGTVGGVVPGINE